MPSDMDWGAIFGRPVVPAPAPRGDAARDHAPVPSDPVAELERLRGLSLFDLERHIADLLDNLRRREGATDALELHEDGSTRVASMVAVYLLAEVASTVGRARLVTLSTVARELLESVHGLARLVGQSIATEVLV
jgi:hypothetical protein